MWTLIGPFDSSQAGEINFDKPKLVKPGKEYIVGRKDCSLLINHKRVSRKHLVFTVGEYKEDDVDNPDKIPDLIVHSLVSNRPLHRGESELTVNAGSSATLQDGDRLEVVHDIQITIKWEKVVCYCPPSLETASLRTEECAKLGISMTWKLHPSVTHHITSELTVDPAIATSLLSLTKFVKPDWLKTVLAYGASSDPTTSLETKFSLPSPSHHRPTLSAHLPSSLKNHRSWEPNEDRVDLLKAYRVIFVGERGKEVTDEYKELVRRGAATYECCPVQGGRRILHSVLAKGMDKGKDLVIVGDQSAMVAAVGQDDWDDLTREAAQYGLRFIPPSKLVEAVVHVDLSYIDCKLSQAEQPPSGSVLPDVVLNTHPSEPTMPPYKAETAVESQAAPRKRLVRRAASRASSRAPSPITQDELSKPTQDGSSRHRDIATPDLQCIAEAATISEEGPKPRKRLTRRVGVARPTIIGIDDPSVVEDGPIELPISNEMPAPEVNVPAVSNSRPNRLKRRFGVTQPPESQLFAAIDASLVESERPHKKYRALFDESDPDRITRSIGDELTMGTGSITQPETFTHTQDLPRQSAAAVALLPEEIEESAVLGSRSSQLEAAAKSQPLEWKTRLDGDGDADMADDEENQRPSKRVLVACVESGTQSAAGVSHAPSKPTMSKIFTSTQATGDTSQKSGAVPGKPDRDEAFLKAVASTKRGKKQEDTFDREFNNLRISKPDLESEKAKDDWAVLADFDDDADLRGNFMVVVEMEVFRKDIMDRSIMRTAGGRADWEGRADFKKFKRKAAGERRNLVELVVEDDDGFSLIQDTRSGPSQVQPDRYGVQKTTTTSQTQRRAELIMDSDDDLPLPSKSKRNVAQIQPEPQPRAKKTAQSKTTSRKKTQPLFLASDEDRDEGENELAAQPQADNSESDPESTLATAGRRTQPSRSNAKKRPVAALIMDDDSDDGMTFKGFGARKKTKR